MASDPPLMRQVRAAIVRKALPQFSSIVYGLGGYPLRNADLVKLCQELEEKGQGHIFLSIEFARVSFYPIALYLISR
jgi:pyruvate-ferredoxin/flavodoxin oxidoreductase